MLHAQTTPRLFIDDWSLLHLNTKLCLHIAWLAENTIGICLPDASFHTLSGTQADWLVCLPRQRRLTSEDAAELLGESEVSANDLLPGKYEGELGLPCACTFSAWAR